MARITALRITAGGRAGRAGARDTAAPDIAGHRTHPVEFSTLIHVCNSHGFQHPGQSPSHGTMWRMGVLSRGPDLFLGTCRPKLMMKLDGDLYMFLLGSGGRD